MLISCIQVKFDFYYMHNTNCSVFWPSFNNLTFLTKAHKVRLLQRKAYIDLAMYASRRSPKLHLEEITKYVPAATLPDQTSWDDIFQRLFKYSLDGKDDGHAIKLGRAVRNGQQISKKWEGKEEFRVKGEMWEKIANMVIDSVEDDGVTWVRSAGFDKAWEDYHDRKRPSGATL